MYIKYTNLKNLFILFKALLTNFFISVGYAIDSHLAREGPETQVFNICFRNLENQVLLFLYREIIIMIKRRRSYISPNIYMKENLCLGKFGTQH